jgi:ABC-type oligopeptide transport system substrate-binding subunit
VLAAALIAVLLLTAAGCGGGNEEASPPPPAETGGAGAEPAPPAEPAGEQVLRWALGSDLLLDPQESTDTTSAKVQANLYEGLLKLGDDLQPHPALAESWDVAGPKVTFHLRKDGKWTNGDPVTANDFVYAWKRILSPELGAYYSYQLWGIKGAQDYSTCEKNCDALANDVAVKAVDDYTLEVTLTSEQPWFLQQATHNAFLPIHEATVEQFGDKWATAQNIVTNGPFKVESFEPGASIVLVKNEDWHDAANVTLDRVEGRIIVDGTTAVSAFEAGEVDVLDEQIPVADTARLKETPDYQSNAGLATAYYVFNVKNVPDVNQRRAMSAVVNRKVIVDNISQGGETPATGLTPIGMPGFDVINPKSPYLAESGDVDLANQLMSKVKDPVKHVTLFVNDGAGNKEVAVAIQSDWKKIGIESDIKILEWQQFLDFIGPPPNEDADVMRLGWAGDFVDAVNFLELALCDSGNNQSNYCDPAYDKLIEKAKATPDNDARYALYAQAERMLFGKDGAFPFLLLYWDTYPNLVRPKVQGFKFNLLDIVDLTKVSITE